MKFYLVMEIICYKISLFCYKAKHTKYEIHWIPYFENRGDGFFRYWEHGFEKYAYKFYDLRQS